MYEQDWSPGQGSCAADGRAKTSAAADDELGSLGQSQGFGESSAAPLAIWDRRSSSWKTSQMSLLGGGSSSLEILPNSGSMRSGRLFERATLGRRTRGTDGSLWPTPVASDSTCTASAGYQERTRHGGHTLQDAMATHHGLRPQDVRNAGADGLVLRPEFVEGLMGIPEGWTHVDDEHASAALATRYAPRKR